MPALIEMVKIDPERQWEHGRRVDLESYLGGISGIGNSAASRQVASSSIVHALIADMFRMASLLKGRDRRPLRAAL
jgi:hypothetical protein